MNSKIPGKRVVGLKQTLRAVKSGTARTVYVAENAEEKIKKQIVDTCKEKNVEIVYVQSMEKLGDLCGISVGAATACIIGD
jgi:large subunit ribosomal protein L7A